MTDTRRSLALLMDLYELTMAAVYHANQMFAPATFSLYIREYPPDRGYFVSAGLDDALTFLESFRFRREELDYLDSLGLFSNDFLHYLDSLRFTGDVLALPEGRVFFKDEPILEVTAPVIEAQIAETVLLNTINFQTAVASKAARCIHAARGRKVVDFSLRRTQGADAGLKVARASYIAGFSATSNVLAGKLYGIPVSGTMAHSFITSFEEEIDAFRAFAGAFPQNAVLLIDTYDTLVGARKAARVGREMASRGEKLKGVRLDSGDMAELSKQVREILDRDGLAEVSVFASGGFDEFKIHRVLEQGARIDAFGVGTKMGVSADAPYNDIAYKLVRYNGRPVLKLSEGKKTLVSEKQVSRRTESGVMRGDVIGLRGESLEGEPLLEPFMSGGQRCRTDTLAEIRERFAEDFALLAEPHKALRQPLEYPVRLSDALAELQREVVHEMEEKELGES